LMLKEPERIPAADGVKLTATAQDAEGAILLPAVQVLLAILNSEPLTLVAPRTSGAVPELVNVTVWDAAVAPTLADANVSAALDRVAAGAVTTTAAPIPASDSVLIAGVAL